MPVTLTLRSVNTAWPVASVARVKVPASGIPLFSSDSVMEAPVTGAPPELARRIVTGFMILPARVLDGCCVKTSWPPPTVVGLELVSAKLAGVAIPVTDAVTA